MWNYKEYWGLCSQLTSRNTSYNYEQIVEELMVMLKIKAINSTIELSEDRGINEEQRDAIMDNIELIFENKLRDQNYIGFINIILLQCVIAFTERYGTGDDFEMELFLEMEWTNTEVLTDFIKREHETLLVYLEYEGREYTLENIEDPSVIIFLVIWNDKFSSDEIIQAYFLNIQYGEVVTSERWADSEKMTPYAFLTHDIVHLLAGSCYTERGYDLPKMKHFFDFYKYCSTLNKEQFRKIRVYVFLQIHEGGCYLDPNEITDKGITIFEFLINTIDNTNDATTSGWDVERLNDKTDLMEMVPRNILKIKLASERKKRIKQYLLECIRLYKEEYDAWNATRGGSSKKRKSRVKKFKGKTTRKKR